MWAGSSKASGSLGGLVTSTPASGSEAASAPSERRETHIMWGQKQAEASPLSHASEDLLMGPWADTGRMQRKTQLPLT